VLYLDDGDILTSAGTAAGIDCCLHLLRKFYGAAVASAVARRLVVAPHRQGGQAQFIEQPLPPAASNARLAGLLDRLRGDLASPHTVDSIAASAALSRRSLTRHFRAITGLSVHQWLLAERLALCQRLLEAGPVPLERVADLCGFGSATSLRQHFRTRFGLTPSAWRAAFGTGGG